MRIVPDFRSISTSLCKLQGYRPAPTAPRACFAAHPSMDSPVIRARDGLPPIGTRSMAATKSRCFHLEELEDRTVPATHIWSGATSGGVWSTAANWNGGKPTNNEVGGTIVQFNGAVDSTDDIATLL